MSDPTYEFQRHWEDTDPTTAEINRLSDENKRLKSILSDIIGGARRDRSILVRSVNRLHLINTTVTKGQVLDAIDAVRDKRD